jgi:hypothetical protein
MAAIAKAAPGTAQEPGGPALPRMRSGGLAALSDAVAAAAANMRTAAASAAPPGASVAASRDPSARAGAHAPGPSSLDPLTGFPPAASASGVGGSLGSLQRLLSRGARSARPRGSEGALAGALSSTTPLGSPPGGPGAGLAASGGAAVNPLVASPMGSPPPPPPPGTSSDESSAAAKEEQVGAAPSSTVGSQIPRSAAPRRMALGAWVASRPCELCAVAARASWRARAPVLRRARAAAAAPRR